MNPGKRLGYFRTSSACESLASAARSSVIWRSGLIGFDRRRRQRQDLPVLWPELLEHPEAHVQIVKKRNVEPALDRSLVHRDGLQALEEWLRKDVIEDVDFDGHVLGSSVTGGERGELLRLVRRGVATPDDVQIGAHHD